ncbi:MAG TPA: ABC transporter ATP-binding protein [Trueperaceae bacterium]
MSLRLSELTKKFGDVIAVDGVSLELTEGERLALLGPSGCGKSTLLRLVAGLEKPDSGSVSMGGSDVTRLPPQRRDTGMVFQDFALFPHLDVAGNVGFGLVEAGWPRDRVNRRVGELLDLVSLPGLGARKVYELSGGQQQRVALARALAGEPSLLLLDEPLSNLDPDLRGGLQRELRSLLDELGITAVYVTHDQEEAFMVAPRVAVMRAGRVAQQAPSAELLRSPRDVWTARFLGYRNVFLAGEMTEAPLLLRDDLVRLVPLGEADLNGQVEAIERATHLLRVVLFVPAWGVRVEWQGFERELPTGIGRGDEVGLEVPAQALVPLESG